MKLSEQFIVTAAAMVYTGDGLPNPLTARSTANRGRWIVAFKNKAGEIKGYRFRRRSWATAFARSVRGKVMRYVRKRWMLPKAQRWVISPQKSDDIAWAVAL